MGLHGSKSGQQQAPTDLARDKVDVAQRDPVRRDLKEMKKTRDAKRSQRQARQEIDEIGDPRV